MPKGNKGARLRARRGEDSGGHLYSVDGGKLQLNLHEGQTKAWDSLKRFIFVLAGTQSGKMVDITTPMPTPGGFVPMGDLQIGDAVYDERGETCAITGVSDIQYGDCYRITFDDGASIIADANHQWLTQTANQRKNQSRQVKSPHPNWTERPQCKRGERYSVRTTQEIIDTLHVRVSKNSELRNNHSIGITGAVRYPERDLLIPPYTLGAWLGDGSSSDALITTHDQDAGILEQIELEGVSVCRRGMSGGKCPNYTLGIAKKQKRRTLLRKLNIYKNKHIPELYLTASASQRLELLRGLMDTDGSCGFKGEGSSCEFTTIRPQLAKNFIELCRSLGIKARMCGGRAMLNGKDYGPKYRVYFSTDIRVFHLDRKASRQRPIRADMKRRFIANVEPVESVPCKCISVDSPSNLYLASRDYIVTHNTSFAPWWLHNELLDTWTPGGGNDYLAVTSSFDLFKLKFLPEMTKVFCDVLDIGRWYASDRMIEIKCLDPDDDRYMQFYAETANDPMWARIVLRSAQSEGGLESTTAKAAVLDECGQPGFSLQSWEAINRRLSITQGRVLGITTPYNLGWIYTHIYLPWLSGDPDIDIIQFSSHMNPSFPMKEYERAKKKLPDWRFAMFYDGQFRRPAGLIYQDFNEITMTCGPISIDPSWEHVVGVDFGGANNATLWLARNPEDNRWYAYHETLMGHRSTADHVRNALDTAYGISDLTAIGGAAGETQQRLDWDAEGFVIEEPPVFDLEAGISRVISLIKDDRLRIFRNLRGILNDLGGYRRKLDESGEPTNDIVFKKRFHYADALRYACTWIEDEGGTDILGYVDFRTRYKQQ